MEKNECLTNEHYPELETSAVNLSNEPQPLNSTTLLLKTLNKQNRLPSPFIPKGCQVLSILNSLHTTGQFQK